LLETTLEDCFNRFGGVDPSQREHLCLDKGYDSVAVRELVESVCGYVSHIRSRGEERKAMRANHTFSRAGVLG
jgi:hypothetical protein